MMDQSQSIPQSLVNFMRQDGEVAAFEEFTNTELDIPSPFKEPSQFDVQRVQFRNINLK